MTGDVNLGYAFGGHCVHVIHWGKLVIHGGDVDIVDVEKDAAIGTLDHFGEEFPLGHFGAGEGCIAADVFNGDGNLKEILHHADAFDGALDGLPCVGEWKQVMRVGSI